MLIPFASNCSCKHITLWPRQQMRWRRGSSGRGGGRGVAAIETCQASSQVEDWQTDNLHPCLHAGLDGWMCVDDILCRYTCGRAVVVSSQVELTQNSKLTPNWVYCKKALTAHCINECIIRFLFDRFPNHSNVRLSVQSNPPAAQLAIQCQSVGQSSVAYYIRPGRHSVSM